MKNKEQKYQEAIERNFLNAERNKKNGKNKYQGVSSFDVCSSLGVRNDDSRYLKRAKELSEV
jgi:hypothetical protein